ncbi:MAG: hypothetical protein JJE17_01385 [Peptostreptococcaceae bacterium]|nr:hypothetical protein [Peptostreptococcaceae bacterium]
MRKFKLFQYLVGCGILLATIAIANAQNPQVPFKVEKGIIYSEKGIPQTPRWFTDSRLAFQFDETGITRVDYYNPTETGFNLKTVFLRHIFDGFRYCIEQDQVAYKPEYKNTKMLPFGIESEWDFQGVTLKHRVMAINEDIVIQLIVPDKVPANLRFNFEFYETFGVIKGDPNDFRFTDYESYRQWDKWQFNTKVNTLIGGFVKLPDDPKVDKSKYKTRFLCGVSANFPIEYSVTKANEKDICKSPVLEPGKTYSFIVNFGCEKEAFLSKTKDMVKNVNQMIEKQLERYQKIADNSPELISPYKELNNFMSLAPMFQESLKINDYHGVLRSNVSDYWAWGWDNETCNTAYWGDAERLKNMLAFFEKTADPVKGTVHYYNYDGSVGEYEPTASQGFWITMLQTYYTNTGDLEEVKKRYPFAKTLFKKMCANEVGKTGLIEGTSLFPDFRNLILETGHDISSYNNTIFYAAVRSMEYLSALVGDEPQQQQALDFAKKIESNYIKLFYDTEKKFVVSSIDSKTFKQRSSYTAGAIRWENNYCNELTEPIQISSLDFFEKNLVCKAGIREVPIWAYSWDKDANQLHSWWPITSEYFLRIVNSNNRKDLMEKWIGWVSYWTKKLTVPESVSCYFDTDEPENDRWNTEQGGYQMFTLHAWYQGIVNDVVGVDVEPGGIAFHPYAGEKMTLKGLNYLGKKFDIEMAGSGPYIDVIETEGSTFKAINKLPSDVYKNKQHTKVRVHRVDKNPYPVSIVYATGIEFSNYNYTDGKIKASLSGAGLCRLKIKADKMPSVKLEGEKPVLTYDANLHLATVELNLKPGKTKQIHISL